MVGLAETIATSLTWKEFPDVSLVVNVSEPTSLAVIGDFDSSVESAILGQSSSLKHACSTLTYVSYERAEQDCSKLASDLISKYGYKELSQYNFAALPRGGLIILGIMSYYLGINPSQLLPPPSSDVPLIIFDDCALTGARFGQFLESSNSQKIIFAPLYSHPGLRAAIENQEPRVISCHSAYDLHDYAVRTQGTGYPFWQDKWFSRLGGRRYWIGQLEHLCFAWNEPDYLFWNPISRKVENSWKVVLPSLCLKNRIYSKKQIIPIQIQTNSKGPLRPSKNLIFGEFNNQVAIYDFRSGRKFRLSDVASDIWRMIIKHGDQEAVENAMLNLYEVDKFNLQKDIQKFINDLIDKDWLEDKHTTEIINHEDI